MKIFITGGSGFIGQHLSRHFLSGGHWVKASGTRLASGRIDHPHFEYIRADTTREGAWQEHLRDVDAVVNLAGKSIFQRWSKSHKKAMLDSRVLTTRRVVEALPSGKDVLLCSASAVGFYGADRQDEVLSEKSEGGTDFLASLARDWETEALEAEKKGVRVVITRFGIVLGREGGALKQMIPVFKAYCGGPLGSGRQWFPWVHLSDLKAVFSTALENTEFSGQLNLSAPNPVRNRDFAKALGRALNRPALVSVPGFMLRLALGEFGNVLLGGQRMIPERLLELGFRFEFADVDGALADLVGRAAK